MSEFAMPWIVGILVMGRPAQGANIGPPTAYCLLISMDRNSISWLVAFCIWPGVSGAGTSLPVVPSLTLDDAVRSALSDNAQLASERSRSQAMQERPAQAATLPDPMFVYSGMDLTDGGNWPNTNEKRFMVQQEFPWFGKLSLREQTARKDAEAAQWRVDASMHELVMNVKESYYDLYSVQRSIAITRSQEQVVQRMESVAQTMYGTGTRPQTDVLKSQTEATMLRQKLLELQSQENTLKAKLNTFMNREVDAPVGELVTAVPEEADPNVRELLVAAAVGRPEIRAAQAEVDRYGLETDLAGKDYAPDWRLGAEYRSYRGGDDMFMFVIGVNIPLWQSKYRAGVQEAQKMRAAGRAAREAAQRQSSLDVQDAAFKLTTARQTLDLYRKQLIPQAEARMTADEAGYQTGTVSFLDLLESERFLLNARLMAAMAEGNVGMQRARLERAVGRELSKSKTTPSESAASEGIGNGN
jgi:outer membrane protein, heavy metal efflux system